MRGIVVATLIMSASLAAAEPRRASSGPERRSLLELYTSEGCSSCPPTDAWLRAHAAQLQRGRVVPIALHVDYWNEIGWVDPFSQPRFSARQRAAAGRAGSESVYTPELMLNGREVARGAIDAQVLSVPSTNAKLTLEASDRGADRVQVSVRATDAGAAPQLYLAICESGLSVNVRSGENAGRVLEHDFVVRELIGPLSGNALEREVALPAAWNRAHLTLVAFVENPRSGEVLQVVDLPVSPR
jgi:hypothetical protein